MDELIYEMLMASNDDIEVSFSKNSDGIGFSIVFRRWDKTDLTQDETESLFSVWDERVNALEQLKDRVQ